MKRKKSERNGHPNLPAFNPMSDLHLKSRKNQRFGYKSLGDRFLSQHNNIIFHMGIIQILNTLGTNSVRKVESKIFEEESEKTINISLHGDFVKTPEFKCYTEAIKDVNKVSLSYEKIIQGSFVSFVGLFIISLITFFVALSLTLVIQKWFFVIVMLVLIILLLIIRLWQNIGAVHTETIKCINSLNTKLSNEKEKFEKN